MKTVLGAAFAMLVLAVGVSLASAAPKDEDDVLESYTARLSRRDHKISEGRKLTEAVAILQQDRANYHKYHYHDPDREDEGDEWFAQAEHRDEMADLLARGKTKRSMLRAIVEETPLVEVTLRRDGETKRLYLNVTYADIE